MKLIIIKLGGSVVTDKGSSKPLARINVINNLSKQIANLDKKYSIVLVHGAGSYGHPIVKKYSLNKGMKTKEQKEAFGKTQQLMLELNKKILDSLIKAKVRAISLAPHSFITQTNGKLNSFDIKVIQDYLKSDQTPVLFGDAVIDSKWGCSILSGDTIVSYLTKRLKPEKIIFLSDVDGIFDKDPKRFKNAKLIPQINNQNLAEVLKGISESGRADVTGEMRGKILTLKKMAHGIPISIINGLKDEIDSGNGTILKFD